MEERPGEAGFTVLPEPPNEAPAKVGFGGAVLHLLLGKHNRSRVKAVLDGSRFEPRGSTGDIGGSTPAHVSLCESI